MNKPPTRDIVRSIISSFLKSFRPRQITGDFKGEDYYGNKYYEIPADPSRGKRKTSRWHEPVEKDNTMAELPGEW